MKKTNYFTILAIISIICAFILPSFIGKTLYDKSFCNLILCLVCVVLSICSIVFASKNETSKAPGIILLIIGIIASAFMGLMCFVFNLANDTTQNKELCEKVVVCDKSKKGVSKCYFEGDNTKAIPITCKDSNLKKELIKK